jgi:hypothetical protein
MRIRLGSLAFFSLLLLTALSFTATPALGQSWASVPADFVLNNNNGQTAGTTMTLPIMTSSSQSSSCTLGSTCTWTAGDEGPGDPALISNFSIAANQNVCSNLGSISLNNTSTTIAAASLNYNSIEFDATHNAQAALAFSGGASGITALSGLLCAITPPFTNSGSDWDYWDFWAVSGYYSIAQFNDTACGTPASLANYGVRVEHGHPTSHGPNCVHLVPQTAYLFSHYYNFSTGQTYLYVYTTTGTLIGSISFKTAPPGGDSLLTMSFGNGESNSSSTPYYFNWMLLNWKTAPNPYYFWASGSSAGVEPPTNLTATVQ